MKDIWDNAVTSELKYGVIVTCLFLTISDDLSIFLRFTGLRQRRVAPVVDLTIPIPYNEPRLFSEQDFDQNYQLTISWMHPLLPPSGTSSSHHSQEQSA